MSTIKNASFSQSTSEIDEAIVLEAVRNAKKDTAAAEDIAVGSVADKCGRNLETDAAGFVDMLLDHFSGGNELIDSVCSHCKMERGQDNPADIRAALEKLRF